MHSVRGTLQDNRSFLSRVKGILKYLGTFSDSHCWLSPEFLLWSLGSVFSHLGDVASSSEATTRHHVPGMGTLPCGLVEGNKSHVPMRFRPALAPHVRRARVVCHPPASPGWLSGGGSEVILRVIQSPSVSQEASSSPSPKVPAHVSHKSSPWGKRWIPRLI